MTFFPIIVQEYPESQKDLTASFGEYYKGGTVPDYKTVHYSFMAKIQPNKSLDKQNEQQELEKMLRLVQYWNNNNFKGGFKVVYENETYRFTLNEI
jgi:hypothetical protein